MIYRPTRPVSRTQIGYGAPVYPVPPVLPVSPIVRRDYGVRISDNPSNISNPTEVRASSVSITKRITGVDVAFITIPSARNWAGILTPLVDNLVEVYLVNHRQNGTSDEDQIYIGPIKLIDPGYGARSSSIQLNCEVQKEYVSDRTWTAEGVSYQASFSGKSRIRCRIIPRFNPGDTLDIGDFGTLISSSVTIVISPPSAVWMEAYE